MGSRDVDAGSSRCRCRAQEGGAEVHAAWEKAERIVGAGSDERVWQLEERELAFDQASRSLRIERRCAGEEAAFGAVEPVARRNRREPMSDRIPFRVKPMLATLVKNAFD